MHSVRRLGLSLVTALAFVALDAPLAHATVQEAFICTLREGKTMEDLMKVASDFKASIKSVKGGTDYQAQVLAPIASQNLSTLIWIGRMPDFASMAAFSDAFNASDAGKRLNPQFQAVTDCESRSFWEVHPVE